MGFTRGVRFEGIDRSKALYNANHLPARFCVVVGLVWRGGNGHAPLCPSYTSCLMIGILPLGGPRRSALAVQWGLDSSSARDRAASRICPPGNDPRAVRRGWVVSQPRRRLINQGPTGNSSE